MDPNNAETQSIILTRQKETNDFVWYKFEILFLSDKTATDKRGRVSKLWEPRYGIIKFQKSGTEEETTYQLIEEETDELILKSKHLNKLISKCLFALFRAKMKNEYAEKLAYQSS